MRKYKQGIVYIQASHWSAVSGFICRFMLSGNNEIAAGMTGFEVRQALLLGFARFLGKKSPNVKWREA